MAGANSRWLVLGVLAGAVMGPGLILVPWVTVGALAVAVVAAATVVRPKPMMVVSFLLIVIGTTEFRGRDPTAVLSGAVDFQVILELALYGCAAMIAILVARTEVFRASSPTRWEWVLLAFVFFAITSSIWSVAPVLTAVRAGQLSIVLILVLVSIRVLGPSGTLAGVLVAAVLYTLIMSGHAMIWPGAAMTTVGAQPARFAWLYTHPIIVGEFAATSALFLMALCLMPDRHSPYLKTRWLVLLGLVIVVVATRSRGPIIAFAVAATVFSLRGTTRSGLPGVAVSTAIAVAAAVALVVTPVEILRMGEGSDNPVLSLLYRGQTVEQLMTFTGRVELWQGILPLIEDRYLVGYGYLGSRGLLLRVMPWAGVAHSAFMESMLDLGIIGSLLIWAAVASAMFPGRFDPSVRPQELRRSRGVIFGIMVFIVLSSITTDSFVGSPGYTTLLVFTCVVVAERLRHPESS